MNSIRRALLRYILIGVCAVAIVSGFAIYNHVRSEINELYDAQIQKIARNVAQLRNAGLSNGEPQARAWEEDDFLLQVWSRDGVLISNDSPVVSNIVFPFLGKDGYTHLEIDGQRWRGCRVTQGATVLQVAQPNIALQSTIKETTLTLLLPLFCVIPFYLLVVWFGVWLGLKKLDEVSQAIKTRSASSMTPLVLSGLPDELQALVNTINGLLLRLQAAMNQQREFVADAAHELRTPIAALRLQLELFQRSKSETDTKLAHAQLESGFQRITHLVNQLLAFARTESEGYLMQKSAMGINLSRVIRSSLESYLPLAQRKSIDIGVTSLDDAEIQADPSDVQTVLDNLLSNAIKHTPPQGQIDIEVHSHDEQVEIAVIDTGPGIPETERTRVFNRFYRLLDANDDSSTVVGSGLGLAIVQGICVHYGAAISIKDGPLGKGTRVEMLWPKRV